MPLVKYYNFIHNDNENDPQNTCYDGTKGFLSYENNESKSGAQKVAGARFYPDEFLIAHILTKYLAARPLKPEHLEVVILTEPWLHSRKGGFNTLKINDQIEEAIQQLTAKPTLILVPFLYGYHHPGIAIDVQNKVAIYLDPWGRPNKHYVEAQQLEVSLKKLGFEFFFTETQQQRCPTDKTSCGPILTASMIKFIEEFFTSERISPNGFEQHKKNLATDRMFQMYVNNTVGTEGITPALEETMLAKPSLWKAFFREQNINDETLISLVVQVVKLHKKHIKDTRDPKVHLIRDFQSRMIESVFLQRREDISIFAQLGSSLLSSDERTISELVCKRPQLMTSENFVKVQRMLGLSACVPVHPNLLEHKENNIEQRDRKIINRFKELYREDYKSGCFCGFFNASGGFLRGRMRHFIENDDKHLPLSNKEKEYTPLSTKRIVDYIKQSDGYLFKTCRSREVMNKVLAEFENQEVELVNEMRASMNGRS